MLRRETLAILQCPSCHASGLRAQVADATADAIVDGVLICDGCGASYEVKAGVPNLIPTGAFDDASWELWKRHLDGFQARRELPSRQRRNLLQRATVESGGLFDAFRSFTGIDHGRVLDLGCGPGNFRTNLGPGVEYHGLDPIALPVSSGFDYVRAVAEFIPFSPGTFDDVVSLSALDHFADPEATFREIRRVLRPGGRLHLVQSVHDVRGPRSMVKFATHWAKDVIETRATRASSDGAPKHVNEFTRATLRERLSREFHIVGEASYSKRWYSPENLFVTVEEREWREGEEPTFADYQE
jgi:SAM-dependent methyltransferase